MKSVVCLSILAVGFACVLACDPNSNNKPICSTENLNKPIRNYWDPTQYWLCSSEGAEAESIPCPLQEGFLSEFPGCVHFSEWKWIPPCAEVANN